MGDKSIYSFLFSFQLFIVSKFSLISMKTIFLFKEDWKRSCRDSFLVQVCSQVVLAHLFIVTWPTANVNHLSPGSRIYEPDLQNKIPQIGWA